MDDARIRALEREVRQQLAEGRNEEAAASGLEARVAALEAVVGSLVARPPAGGGSPRPALGVHPSFRVIDPGGPAPDRCVMEPEKPCVKSHACRTFGY